MPVLRLLRSYSRTFRVISVSSVIQNLLLKKFEVAYVKNALMKYVRSFSAQIVTVRRKKLFKKDAMLAPQKSCYIQIS